MNEFRVRCRAAAVLGTVFVLTACTPASGPAASARTPTLILANGRVMDPDSGLDAVRWVGIADGEIVAISEEPLDRSPAPRRTAGEQDTADPETTDGVEVIDATGLVVAPGFIDLHAHGQDNVSARLQAMDGVTTALEMEVGVFPVGEWLASREGDAILNYGATVGHWGARVSLVDDLEIGHFPTQPREVQARMDQGNYAYEELSGEEVERLVGLVERGLDEGALGVGLGLTYTPGASRVEVLRLFQLAARRSVPAYIHLRGENSGGTLGAFQEAIALAASAGASVHVVHLNSSAGEQARVALEMIRGARERGLDVTTEAYPYTAGSTLIESALFDPWEGRDDEAYRNLQWAATGERLTAETFERYREEGGWVIIHGGRTEETNEWIVAQPDVVLASDGIPFLYGPAHPRGAGTFSRVLGRYVRERETLTLMEALHKMTIAPARRLEGAAPAMAHKGRVQVGADADLTVFDPEAIVDRATYEDGDVPSTGIAHVLVGGTFVVRDGEFVEGVRPGQPVRAGR